VRLVTVRGTGVAVQREDGVVPIAGYADVGELLAAGDAGLAAARDALGAGAVLDGAVELGCPVLSAPAVLCVGLNYRTHIQEMNREPPRWPTLFSKLPRALTGPRDPIPLPAASTEVDYEGELVAVIGRPGRDIPVETALEHVAGVTLMNDVSMRDYQWRTTQWFAGKTWQASTPVGPAVVTLDELPPIAYLELRVSVNGELRQHAGLGDLVFDVPALVADASRIVELQSGDLIATGTPGGVGAASKRFLADGDVVTVEIDGIGRLENRVVAA
jgi:acylpyruvate hydrolase